MIKRTKSAGNNLGEILVNQGFELISNFILN